MDELSKRAISSMNYFFLRIAADRLVDEQIYEEVMSFVEVLAKECDSLDHDIRHILQQEVIEGNYFEGMSRTTVKQLLDSITDDLTGEPIPTLSQFYAELYAPH